MRLSKILARLRISRKEARIRALLTDPECADIIIKALADRPDLLEQLKKEIERREVSRIIENVTALVRKVTEHEAPEDLW